MIGANKRSKVNNNSRLNSSKKLKLSKAANQLQEDEVQDDNSEHETTNEVLRQKLDATLNIVQDMAKEIYNLVNQVNSLQKELKEVKFALSEKSNTIKPSVITEAAKHNISRENTEESTSLIERSKGPFPEYSFRDRTVPRPSSKELAKSLGGKIHSLQFTSSLYVNLIEKAIGPSSATGLDYKAMVKEAILITKSIISNTKEENNIDPNLRWSQVDPTIKLNVYRQLEDATEHLLPLKICAEFWGAHVLTSNFWLKRKKQQNQYDDKTIEDKEDENQESDNANEYLQKRKLAPFSIPFLTHQ